MPSSFFANKLEIYALLDFQLHLIYTVVEIYVLLDTVLI